MRTSSLAGGPRLGPRAREASESTGLVSSTSWGACSRRAGPRRQPLSQQPPIPRRRPRSPNPACAFPAEESNKKHPFPCPTSYRTALTYYLDITNPPRTNVLYELAQYASEPSEQELLRKMASSSGEGKVRRLGSAISARNPAVLRAPWAPISPVSPPCLLGAVPELGGGGPEAHPGHPAGLPVPAAPH